MNQTENRQTRTDLRLTRAPADTPRGRLHRLATIGARAVHEARRLMTLSPAEVTKLRTQARQGAENAARRLLGAEHSQFATYLCQHYYGGLDGALGALELYVQIDVSAICEELIRALVALEVAETKIGTLEVKLDTATRELVIEHGHNERMRASLAAAQVRSRSAVIKSVPAERWEETTRSRTLTDQERRVISDPDAQPGDLERYLREENERLREERDRLARAVEDLEARIGANATMDGA